MGQNGREKSKHDIENKQKKITSVSAHAMCDLGTNKNN
jgi:hypothetical protein